MDIKPKESRYRLDRAITRKLNDIKRLLKNKALVDIILQPAGLYTGYTALHVACMDNNKNLARLLIEDYHIPVNAVAKDGAQPIHLACLFEDSETTKVLLEAGANVNTKLKRNLFLKYCKNEKWRDDFGDKMTILTFAILYNKPMIAINLINNNANLKVKSHTNVTLLMYALLADMEIGQLIAKKVQNRDINARDNNGLSALHYILHKEKYLNFRYNSKELYLQTETQKGLDVRFLIECGADIYATINDDPTTLILNMAAYRHSYRVLEELLPYYEDITKSKALYYATLPVGDFRASLRYDPFENVINLWQLMDSERRRCIILIVKDLINRRTFGLPVPEEEKQLMDELVAKEEYIRELVYYYEQYFIQGTLKNEVIHYGDKSITFYDFILQTCTGKNLRLLVKNQTLIDAFRKSNLKCSHDYQCFNLFTMRIEKSLKRAELLNELKKIEQLREAIPLPYELVLDIIEYLDNYNLEKFIDCFFEE